MGITDRGDANGIPSSERLTTAYVSWLACRVLSQAFLPQRKCHKGIEAILARAEPASHNPPELARLVVGCLPSSSKKVRQFEWRSPISRLRDILREKLRRIGWLVIGNAVGRCRQIDDDLIVHYIDPESAPRVWHRG